MIVIDPPRFNTIRLIESRLNRVHIGVSRFNRVSDHKYLNYRKRCGERYIHWKKERKEKRKEKKENASVTRKREIKRVKLFVYSPRLRSRDTSAILFGTYFQGVRAQDRKCFTRRGDLSRLREFPPCSWAWTQWRKWSKPVHGRTSDRRSSKPISAFPIAGKVLSGWGAEQRKLCDDRADVRC